MAARVGDVLREVCSKWTRYLTPEVNEENEDEDEDDSDHDEDDSDDDG